MADTTKDIWNDNDGEEEQPRKPRHLRNFLIFFLTLAVVLGVVLVAAYRDGTGFDVLRRFFSYGTVEKAGGEPMDKAGSYGIQGQAAAFVKEIHGDYNNVVGLPVGRLYQELKKLGVMEWN